MKCSYRPLNEPGNRVSGLIVNGSPIELERYYTVATNDYIALGGDGILLVLF